MAGRAQQLTVEELEDRTRAAKDVAERSHCQVIWLLAKGHSTRAVAEIVALSPRSINKLARRYQAEGVDALGDRRRGNRGAGRCSRRPISRRCGSGWTPPDDGGLWSGPKLARWIAARLGLVQVPAPRGWEALQKLGRSLRVPRPKNPPGGAARRAGGVQEKLAATLAEETASHPGTPVELWATDEHRLGLKPVRRRVWRRSARARWHSGHHRFEWL